MDIKIDKNLFLLLGILFLALFLRLYRLEEIPYLNLVNAADEARIGLHVHELLTGKRFIIMKQTYVGPYQIYFLLPSFLLFGMSIFSIRILTVFLSILSLIFLYFFTKDFYDKQTAIVSVLFLSILTTYVHLSRIGWEVCILPFFSILMLFLFERYRIKNKDLYLFLLFLIAGVGICIHLVFIYYVVAFFVCSFLLTRKINIKKMVIAALFFVLGALPIIYYNISTNFQTLSVIAKNFPETGQGYNNLDLYSNLKIRYRQLHEIVDGSNVDQLKIIGVKQFPFFILFCISIPVVLFDSFIKKSENLRKDFFLIVLIFFILVESSFTLSNLAHRHLAILLPLPFILISRMFTLFSTYLDKTLFSTYLDKKFAQFRLGQKITIALILLILVSSFKSLNIYFESYKDSKGPVDPDIGMSELITFLKENNVSRVVVDGCDSFSYMVSFYMGGDIETEILGCDLIEGNWRCNKESIKNSINLNFDKWTSGKLVYIFRDSSFYDSNCVKIFEDVTNAQPKKKINHLILY